MSLNYRIGTCLLQHSFGIIHVPCPRNLRETISEQQKALEKYSHEMEEMRTAHSGQKLSLERENDLLREQLKKYVSFVQSQHKEIGSNSSSSGQLSFLCALSC